ncbi:MAG TPA: lasso peptide biosynthesis B2 protein [Solirubrobacteraceae bacterium]|nr:lasso peptide biosynthesis B2 protein [Solirubrobacteraceae bacterium]
MRRGSSASAARRLAQLPWADRALLAEAAVLLALARLAVVLVPFRVIARRLGPRMAETPRVDAVEPERLRRLTWAIAAVARRTPWRSQCLEQALAAKAMLRRRGIASTLYLGVARGAAGAPRPFDAHAWLRSGTVHVTGGAGAGRYAVVATFADPPAA